MAAPQATFYPPGPERPLPTVELDPVDLTTSAGQAGLQVRVSNLGAPVGAELLGRIAASVSLRTWPEQQAVALIVTKTVDATGKSGQDAYAHIQVAPASPLADRWYALAIDGLPSGAAWAAGSGIPLAGSGRAVRFRVGSGAIVTSVRVYPKPEGKQIVLVDVSEPIPVGSGQVALSYASGTAPACQRDAEAIATTTSPGARDTTGLTLPQNAAAAPSATSVRLGCTGGIDLQQPIRLDVRLGGVTAGQAADASGAVQITITPDSWHDLGDGGKLFKTTL